MIWRILLGIGVAGCAFFTLTPIGRYLARGAYEEATILRNRRPIAALIRDSTVDAATRAKLSLVLDAREYAVRTLRLNAKESFTMYTKLDSDTLVLVLTVAHRDTLAIKTWWWPIVGRVPYQGFFDFNAARKAQAKFDKQGFDTELRPSSAFSTLGWFNDPLLSSTLESDSTVLVDTVIHELLHNTLWIPGDVSFNESFASFVGRIGAQDFFRSRNDSSALRRLQRNRPFEHAIGAFYERMYSRLDSAFRAHPGREQREQRIAIRDTLIAEGRRELAMEIAPRFNITDTTWAGRVRLNIATVLARRVYRDNVDDFEKVHEAGGGDLRNTISRVGAAVRAAPKGGAFDAVARLAREGR